MKNLLLWAWSLAVPVAAAAQTLPEHWTLDNASHRLITAGVDDTGLYDSDLIRELRLTFPAANYWSQLTQNYGTANEVLAHLEVDGVVYDSVGVSFKGQTSYMMVNGQKKSFGIAIDAFVPNADLMGYKTLNLNNAF
jgi:spore coat protein CotH